MKNVFLKSRLFFLSCVLQFVVISNLNAQVYIYGSLVDDLGTCLPDVNITFFCGSDSTTVRTDEGGAFAFDLSTSASPINKLPPGVSVSDNYPNPFGFTTQFEIILPKEENVSLQVFNQWGQQVGKTAIIPCNIGYTDFKLELPGQPDGIYFTRFRIGSSCAVIKKIALCRALSNLTTEISGKQPATYYLKSVQSIRLDSVIASNNIIGRVKISDLPSIINDTLNLENLKIDRFCTDCQTVWWLGRIYNTVKIGNQCWLRENLNVGQMISVLGNQSDNLMIEKYCFDDDEDYICNKYGGLYQWAETVQYLNGASINTSPTPSFTEQVQGICPTGWHVPSLEEFEELSDIVDHNGNSLKLVGEGYDAGIGTNISGFSALLAGPRGSENYGYEGNQTDFWTSSEANEDDAFLVTLVPHSGTFFLGTIRNKKYGFSVRCIKDSQEDELKPVKP